MSRRRRTKSNQTRLSARQVGWTNPAPTPLDLSGALLLSLFAVLMLAIRRGSSIVNE